MFVKSSSCIPPGKSPMKENRLNHFGFAFAILVMLSSRDTLKDVISFFLEAVTSRASITLVPQKAKNNSLRDLYSKRGAASEIA